MTTPTTHPGRRPRASRRVAPGPTVQVLVDPSGDGSDADADAGSPGQDRAGRDAAFTAFMAEHSAGLLRTAWLLCGDTHRAEELVQQALIRTYTAWARTSDPLAYTRRVLVNLRVDTWRRRRREVLAAPEDLPETGSGDAHASTHDRDQLVRALALLTPRQRRIVVLRHLVGLSEAEVAESVGVSVGTVKSTASRALATLRATLTETDPTARTVLRSTAHDSTAHDRTARDRTEGTR